MSGWEIFFNSAQLIAYGVGSGALAWASWKVWGIHKTNQDVQLHRIGKLTEKELEVLYWACHGGVYPHQDNVEAIDRLLLFEMIERHPDQNPSTNNFAGTFTGTVYGYQRYFQQRSEEKEEGYDRR